MEENKIALLKETLEVYKEKWEWEREKLPKYAENIRMHVKLNSMIYLAQWIINSINGGLDKPHATNICNIILNENKIDLKEDIYGKTKPAKRSLCRDSGDNRRLNMNNFLFIDFLKYIIVLLIWLLIKPISLFISVCITLGWVGLLELNVWWGYVLAFLPTIILWVFLFIEKIKGEFDENDIGGILLVYFSIVPPILISILLIFVCFIGFEFPNTSVCYSIKEKGIIKSFVDLFI